MSTRSDTGAGEATTENPHRILHKVTFITCAIFLAVQVIEGALMIPLILVYFGFPQIGIQEICAELYNIAYDDNDRNCKYPYPLFFQDPTPEPNHKESKEQVFGPVIPPRTHYKVPGWREMIAIVERHRAAAEAARGIVDHE